MKNLLFLFILLINFKQSFAQLETDSVISVKLEITGIQASSYKLKHRIFYSTRMMMTNNSSDTVSLYTMDCSWQDSWIVDNDDIFIRGNECDENIDIHIKLAPKESLVFNGIIGTKCDTIGNKQFRMGFVNFDVKALWNWQNLGEKELIRNHKIYWSNSISLDFWKNKTEAIKQTFYSNLLR
jgi:hypothetical protein